MQSGVGVMWESEWADGGDVDLQPPCPAADCGAGGLSDGNAAEFLLP